MVLFHSLSVKQSVSEHMEIMLIFCSSRQYIPFLQLWTKTFGLQTEQI
jgi:hypothetical protein